MLFKNSLILISALMLTVNIVNGANILYLNAVTSSSHHIWNSALANGLAARGHNVTVLSPDKDKNTTSGVNHILIEGLYTDEYFDLLKGFFDVTSASSPVTETKHFYDYWYEMCKATLNTAGFRTLIEYPDDFRFDLIINDFTPGACLLGFVHKFKNPPLISVSAYNHPSYLTASIGGHQYYSYVPHNSLHYDQNMNIFQRMYNFIFHIVELFWHREIFNKNLDKLVEGKFGADLPSMTELEQRTAIAFVNTNPAFDHVFPLPENVISVGGLHIRDTKPLPQDLEDFIASAKKGAVLFSIGSDIRSSAMNTEKQKIILDAFEQLPDYHFLWKFEESSISLKLPKNVLIRKWLPQSDILAHPRVKAFFTHSGLLSTHEAIWHGVPILGMPLGFDQFPNLLKSIRNGFAEGVDFHTMTTEIIKEKFHKILDDPKYYQNAKKLSERFRDQKEKPLDRAIWWVEWLLRNPDSDYLKSPVLRLGFIVGNSYDIIAIVSIVLFVVLVLIMKTSLFMLRALTTVTQATKYKHKKSQ